MLTIGFISNKLTLRGTEVNLYDYADYNELLLAEKTVEAPVAKTRRSRKSSKPAVDNAASAEASSDETTESAE